MLRVTHLLAALAALAFAAMAAAANLDSKLKFSIPAQNLSAALFSFADQAGIQVMTATADLADMKSPGVSGERTAREALQEILEGTGLNFRAVSANAVTIESGVRSEKERGNTAGVKAAPQDVRVAQGDSAVPSQPAAPAEADKLEEVVVTAQKRLERLQDVPVPVTALKAEALVEQGQLRLQDYFSSVPGLTVMPANQSSQSVLIRGIQAQASILVDESPYNPSAPGLNGNSQVPDIDPGELARVEVLRGPQGTLYGASSMGGIVKFVTIDPSTAGFSGSAKAGVSSVKNGDNAGYNARLSVNVPLSDNLAFRASGFTHQDPGYIDNPLLGTRGVNEQRVNGGRISALWLPSSAVSLKVNALYQDTRGDAANDVLTRNGLGDLQQDYIAGTGPYERKSQAYGATLTAHLGQVDLIAISGYNINDISDSFDFSYQLGGLNAFAYGAQASGAPVLNDIGSKKFTQEIRLSGGTTRNLEWLAGAFYTDEKSNFEQNVQASNPASGAVVATPLTLIVLNTYSESAAFADLTWHFTERFSTQFGARQGWIRQTSQQTELGPYTPIFTGGAAQDPAFFPKVNTDDKVFTYLVTPTFKFTPDAMLYARIATGYRPGGPNLSPVNIPERVDPDTTRNYEMGYKASFWDRAVTLDASVFRIDWRDIQAGGFNSATGLTYGFNAGRARSEGVELGLEARPPTTGTFVAAWLTLGGRAKLTEDSPRGAKGDVVGLAGTDVSFNLSVDQAFPLSNGWKMNVGGMFSYVGERRADVVQSIYPAYTKIDFHAGLKLQSWAASLYVNNIADERGVIGGGPGSFPPFGHYFIMPRNVGLTLSRSF